MLSRGNAQDIVDYLNDIIKLDNNAIAKLLHARQLCNSELANHPTVFTYKKDDSIFISFLGILNGLMPKNTYIEAVFEDMSLTKLLEFRLVQV